MSDGLKLATCKYCQANAVWMKTRNGKMMLVDADSIEESTIELTLDDSGNEIPKFDKALGHVPHF